MIHAVLADTGPLYAVADSSDQYHARAKSEMGVLREGRTTVLAPYPTLLEAHALVLRRLGPSAARDWLEDVTAGTGLINPGPQDYAEATTAFRKYSDQPLTLFDTVLAVLSTRLGLPVWTYDHHFEIMRVKLWYPRSG